MLVRNFPLCSLSCLGLIAGVHTRKRQKENKEVRGGAVEFDSLPMLTRRKDVREQD